LNWGSFIKKEAIRINTLIDSGATISVFKTQVAQFLKLPIENGKEIYLGGVGGRIKGYIHNLELEIAGKKLVAPVVFSYEYTVSLNLLGRSAVFKHFKILFDENNLQVNFE
jgi:hypothetical protein